MKIAKISFHCILKPNFLIITKQNWYCEKNRNIAKKMADNSEPAPSKNKKFSVKFNDLWCSKFKFIQKSCKGEGFELCTVHMEENMI